MDDSDYIRELVATAEILAVTPDKVYKTVKGILNLLKSVSMFASMPMPTQKEIDDAADKDIEDEKINEGYV